MNKPERGPAECSKGITHGEYLEECEEDEREESSGTEERGTVRIGDVIAKLLTLPTWMLYAVNGAVNHELRIRNSARPIVPLRAKLKRGKASAFPIECGLKTKSGNVEQAANVARTQPYGSLAHGSERVTDPNQGKCYYCKHLNVSPNVEPCKSCIDMCESNGVSPNWERGSK